MNQFYSFSDVEDGLVEAARLWRRSPGGGRWPFASDGPWHLLTRETRAGDYDARGGDMAEQPDPAPLPLTRAQVGERDQASAWLLLIADEGDRRLVAMGVVMKAATGKRIDWVRMVRDVGGQVTTDGLRMRYNRAIASVARALSRNAA